MWQLVSNIVIGYVLDMWSVLCVLYVGGGTVLDMWSVLCVLYVGVGI